MPVVWKSLASNDPIAGTSSAGVDTLCTATGVKAHITAFTASNTHTSAVTLYVYILPSGVAASTVAPIAIQSIPAGSTAIISDILGHIVPLSGTIAAYAGTTAVLYCTVSGHEIS